MSKVNDNLKHFVNTFNDNHDFSIEPVYSGKMFFALYELIKHSIIEPRSRVVAIHTGGLQGLRGMRPKLHTTDVL